MNTQRMLSIARSLLQQAVIARDGESITRLMGLVFLLQADYIRELERESVSKRVA